MSCPLYLVERTTQKPHSALKRSLTSSGSIVRRQPDLDGARRLGQDVREHEADGHGRHGDHAGGEGRPGDGDPGDEEAADEEPAAADARAARSAGGGQLAARPGGHGLRLGRGRLGLRRCAAAALAAASSLARLAAACRAASARSLGSVIFSERRQGAGRGRLGGRAAGLGRGRLRAGRRRGRGGCGPPRAAASFSAMVMGRPSGFAGGGTALGASAGAASSSALGRRRGRGARAWPRPAAWPRPRRAAASFSLSVNGRPRSEAEGTFAGGAGAAAGASAAGLDGRFRDRLGSAAASPGVGGPALRAASRISLILGRFAMARPQPHEEDAGVARIDPGSRIAFQRERPPQIECHGSSRVRPAPKAREFRPFPAAGIADSRRSFSTPGKPTSGVFLKRRNHARDASLQRRG